MNRWRVSAATFTMALLVGVSAALEAQVCRRGKPCGNTCIARDKTCHVGPGPAQQGAELDTGPRI
jgi:hypothetical protein